MLGRRVAGVGDLRQQRTKAGKRKLRLFACGCCRAACSRLPDDRLRTTAQIAERFAEGLASKEELPVALVGVQSLTADGALPAPTPVYARVAVDMALATT